MIVIYIASRVNEALAQEISWPDAVKQGCLSCLILILQVASESLMVTQ